MPSQASNSFPQVNRRMTHKGETMCQCPLGLVTHFYPKPSEFQKFGTEYVSMPSRACDSFLLFQQYQKVGFYWCVNALLG